MTEALEEKKKILIARKRPDMIFPKQECKAVPSLPPTAADPKAGVRRRHMTDALEEKNKKPDPADPKAGVRRRHMTEALEEKKENPDREEATRYDIP
ncbi:hypothetical protein TNCV_3536851 [Trichonephila clavipes]|uniref:Uncharacterized protein n=1 Tax=Trichonephila clavipes TaxID=2585209 RepID=A0A8X6VWY1_TRICX|nr:hypothetical protein TNCV_3536851 [Trichonephila clavipes]